MVGTVGRVGIAVVLPVSTVGSSLSPPFLLFCQARTNPMAIAIITKNTIDTAYPMRSFLSSGLASGSSLFSLSWTSDSLSVPLLLLAMSMVATLFRILRLTLTGLLSLFLLLDLILLL